MEHCPVCRSSELAPIISRSCLPVMQNVVYPTREAALAALGAPFTLAICKACGFSFNSRFDASLMQYDEAYDNDVPSTVFQRYYADLADMLINRFDLAGGTVYDIGCGKGTFLSALCGAAPGLRGVGIDPSCNAGKVGNIELVRDLFSASQIGDDARLVLLRHVLEHIDCPRDFLASLCASLASSVRLFVEVPELGWILRKGAFWDFCYEHCNYFTQAALKYTLESAGFIVEEQQVSFGGQYQWAVCRANGAASTTPTSGDLVEAARAYALREELCIAEARELANAGSCVLWGMATKGVVLAALVGSERLLGGIDRNPRKQGKFVPASGLQIHPPEWLRELKRGVTVIVMNPNYAEEIRSQIVEMDVDASVVVM